MDMNKAKLKEAPASGELKSSQAFMIQQAKETNPSAPRPVHDIRLVTTAVSLHEAIDDGDGIEDLDTFATVTTAKENIAKWAYQIYVEKKLSRKPKQTNPAAGRTGTMDPNISGNSVAELGKAKVPRQQILPDTESSLSC